MNCRLLNRTASSRQNFEQIWIELKMGKPCIPCVHGSVGWKNLPIQREHKTTIFFLVKYMHNVNSFPQSLYMYSMGLKKEFTFPTPLGYESQAYIVLRNICQINPSAESYWLITWLTSTFFFPYHDKKVTTPLLLP